MTRWVGSYVISNMYKVKWRWMLMKQKFQCKHTFCELGLLQKWVIAKMKQNHPLQISDSVNLCISTKGNMVICACSGIH